LPARTIPSVKIATVCQRGDLFAAIAIEIFNKKTIDGAESAGQIN